MENPAMETNEHERACRRVAALFSERWLRGYVAWKLRADPIFLVAHELFRSRSLPILDIGCGVGLLAFYLRERGCEQAIVGLDRDARKIDRALEIGARRGYKNVRFRTTIVDEAPAEFCGDVALLDVLHYVSEARHLSLLTSVAKRVSERGIVVLRDCLRERRGRFYATYVAEKFAQMISWNVGTPLHFASRAEIEEPFAPDKFTREERPMWGNTPFNNRLFIFRRQSTEVVPGSE